MRTDETLPETFTGSSEWQRNRYDRSLFYGRYSFSGYERNHVFFNRHGTEFTDLSAISGLDTAADSRSFVLFDYDRDGWQDIALVNANAPLFSLYRNEIGERRPTAGQERPGMIALRFVGGNTSGEAAASLAPRDGYGAIVEVQLAGTTLKREHRCGEGFAAQNSSTMIIGIGESQVVPRVTVRWPSGRMQQIDDVAEGALLTVYERESNSPTQTAFTSARYRNETTGDPLATAKYQRQRLEMPTDSSRSEHQESELTMYVAMASWCAACKKSLPQLRYLRSTFTTDQLEMNGVPIDPNDDVRILQAYVNQNQPPYTLLKDVTTDQLQGFTRILQDASATVTPATILTDGRGNIIMTLRGVPTASDIAKALREANE